MLNCYCYIAILETINCVQKMSAGSFKNIINKMETKPKQIKYTYIHKKRFGVK